MKGLRKHGHNFLIMGGGLFIILLIVYTVMRNKEGFFQKPKLPQTPSRTVNNCKFTPAECVKGCVSGQYYNKCVSDCNTNPCLMKLF
jgi:hypothetical protein